MTFETSDTGGGGASSEIDEQQFRDEVSKWWGRYGLPEPEITRRHDISAWEVKTHCNGARIVTTIDDRQLEMSGVTWVADHRAKHTFDHLDRVLNQN